jgi:phosphoribosylglycinamide formyltransferase-1
MPALPRLAILASGAGSNFAALVDGCRRGDVPAQPALLLCNQPRATVLDLAAARNIPARCIDHRAFADRSAFDHALIAELRDQHIDFVALAGFMRILTADFVREYCGSLLNIHPSLLPKYPGLHTHRRALEAGDAMAGATVHYVTPALDAGPAIVQARVATRHGDTPESLERRVRRAEHHIYPLALAWCLQGRVSLRDGAAWMDGEPLGEHGVQVDGDTS